MLLDPGYRLGPYRERVLMAVSIDTEGGFYAGRPQPLFAAPVPLDYVTRNRYVPAPNGQRFLLIKPVGSEDQSITIVLNWAAELASP
jgi:hypothetical protein